MGAGNYYDALALTPVFGAALDDGARQLVAGRADIDGVVLLREDGTVLVTDVAAANRPAFQLDEAVAVSDLGDLGVDDLEMLGADQVRCLHSCLSAVTAKVRESYTRLGDRRKAV